MVTDDEGVKRILELWDDETIFGPILLGHQEGYPERATKKEPAAKWIQVRAPYPLLLSCEQMALHPLHRPDLQVVHELRFQDHVS